MPGKQGELLQEMVFLDPALEAHPQIDRYLLGHGNAQGTISSPLYPGLPLKSARRWAYFEWRDRDIVLDKTSLGLAHSRHLKEFRQVPLMAESERESLCRDICHGIVRLEDLPPIAFQQDGVPLKITSRTPTESALWVVKPFTRFSLSARFEATAQGLERLHTHLELIYRYADGSEEKLLMGAGLFHILMELKDGVQLSDALRKILLPTCRYSPSAWHRKTAGNSMPGFTTGHFSEGSALID